MEVQSNYYHGIHPLPRAGVSFPADDEDVPVLTKPSPTVFDNMKYLASMLDPSLTVTPEKPSKHSLKARTFPQVNGADVGERTAHKVRFDNTVNICHLSPNSPEYQGDSDVDIVNIDRTNAPVKDLSDHLEDFDESVGNVKTYEYVLKDFHKTANSFKDKDTVIRTRNITNNKELPQYTSASRKSDRLTETSSLQSLKAKSLATGSLSDASENVLAQPEYNSTLRVGLELEKVRNSHLHTSAAKEQVRHFETARKMIEDKVTQKVNCQKPAFSNLISVHVDPDSLAKTIEKEAIRPPPAVKTKQKGEVNIEAPDILELLSREMERDTLSYDNTAMAAKHNGPRTALTLRAFDIYTQVQSWEH